MTMAIVSMAVPSSIQTQVCSEQKTFRTPKLMLFLCQFLHCNALESGPNLLQLATFVDEEEGREGFVEFLSQMLCWDPDRRLQANDLANHE